MKKRFFKNVSAVLSALLAFSSFAFAETPKNDFDGETREEKEFVTVRIPYELSENENYDYSNPMLLRYSDTKKPIALSMFYDNAFYGTIPKENENKEIEIFSSRYTDIKFSDEAENDGETGKSYKFYIIKKLAQRGIINGDDLGRALPDNNITRAELSAMILRFLGYAPSNSANTEFSDVANDAWYAKTLAKAKEKGIITGDAEGTFRPEEDVSREEAVAMAARAIWRTGMQKENTSATTEDFNQNGSVQDTENVSPWAHSAYAQCEYYVPFETKETEVLDAEGIPISVCYLNPKKSATRFEVCELLEMLCVNTQIYPSQAAMDFGFDKKMPVIDGSTSTYPFTQAIYSKLFSNGNMHVQKPKKHSKSHTSYELLINGERDMIIASVYPAEDILNLAKSKGVELELIPIAYDAMVFFTNAENKVSNLSQEQISEIYVNNKYQNCIELGGDDVPLYPYARNYDSGSHAQMERHFLNGNEINEKIRKETTSISMSNVLTDVMGCLDANPKGYGLGYSIYYYFNNMDLFYETKTYLKLLSVDGIAPNDETIANGTYPLSNNTYIVLRKNTPKDAPARKMAEFMLTQKGQECVAEAGFGPLKHF